MMKRFLSLLLLAVLLACPLGARADMNLPYRADTVISCYNLTPVQQQLVWYLYDHVLNCETQIQLPDGTRYDDTVAAVLSLCQDYPELFHLESRYSIGYYQDTPHLANYVELSYRMSRQEADRVRQQLLDKARAVVRQNPTAEEMHDALCSMVTYGFTSDGLCYTAIGALLNGTAVCEGYAMGLTLLYRLADIPCGVVTGTATNSQGQTEGHAWNIALLGSYTLIDATWNDQEGGLGYITHWYYGLSDAQLGVNHYPDAEMVVPRCIDSANWHRVRGLYVSTREEAYAALRRTLQTGGLFNVRVTDPALYRSISADISGFVQAFNSTAGSGGLYGGYSYSSNDATQCIVIETGN